MADKYVQLHDADGNNLYPVVADFPVSIANGGTGANNLSNALQNLVAGATEYTSTETGSLTTTLNKTVSYSVSGNGLVFMSVSLASASKTWGTSRVTLLKNGNVIAIGADTMTGTYDNQSINGNASCMVKVSNGDELSVTLFSTRYTSGNTYTAYYNIVAFGCTLI